jgi:hypothetical protein
MSTDDAWRALTLQIDLVKHAESKAGAALASSGVLGGLLYTLISQTRRGGVPFALLAAATAIAVVVSAASAGSALRPRLLTTRPVPSLLFHHGIVHRFGPDSDGFAQEFRTLVDDPAALLSELADQVHANARVAVQKYRSVTLALNALMAALALLALTGVVSLASR